MNEVFANELSANIHKARNVLVCVGAGISVNAGIPDFRSPVNGIYSRIGQSEDVFHIEHYQDDPIPFYKLCSEVFRFDSRDIEPTFTHLFIKRLRDMKKLLRCYTQNIDGLEVKAGLRVTQDVVQCHGNLDCVVCSACRHKSTIKPEEWKRSVFDFVDTGTDDPNLIPTKLKCNRCGGFLKPSVVLFGEPLPQDFFSQIQSDIQCCDLVLIIGTSLTVYPFATIPRLVHPEIPQFMISRGASNTVQSIDVDCDEILQLVSSKL